MNFKNFMVYLLAIAICFSLAACTTTSTQKPNPKPPVYDGDVPTNPGDGDGTPDDNGDNPISDDDTPSDPIPTGPDSFGVLVPDETCIIGDYVTTTYKTDDEALFINSIGKIADFNRDCLGYWKNMQNGLFKVRAKEGTLDKLKNIAVEIGPREKESFIGPYDGAN